MDLPPEVSSEQTFTIFRYNPKKKPLLAVRILDIVILFRLYMTMDNIYQIISVCVSGW